MAERSPDVDAYIAALPASAAARLLAIREALHAAVPDGVETIRYDMPAILLGGRYAIHFAGWKAHAGLYPVPPLGNPLEAEVAPLRSGKDSVVLRYRDPVPAELVTRIAARILELRRG
ncbi:iron chaperone [uncultured Amnibacterium sp.]|uniref:iron chaperone n=1 Tax=uncultured Amnibacterium sp. TaxID=1631851 RepID=UPI0035CA4B13